MYNLNDIKQYEEKKALRKADAMPENVLPLENPATSRPQSQSQPLREGFQQMGKMNPQKPVLETRNAAQLNQMYDATRSQALGHESNQADPNKAMEFWNASPYEFWTEQVKANPENTYAIVNQMFASNETPEQKRKRERREALGETFRGLGNLIGNVANLYYTHRGGQYIDLNSVNEKHRERMEKIKEKQDALAEQRQQILLNAKMDDIKNERAERAAAKKAETEAKAKAEERAWTVKYNALMKELDNTYRMGQIDAQTKANMLRDLNRAKTNADLEAVKHKYAMALESARQTGRKELEGIKEDNKKSTLTYQGTAYKKKDLASMIRLYNKIKADGYKVDEVKSATIGNYIAAILGAKKPELEKDMKAGDAFGNAVLPDLVIEDSDADTQQERDYSQYAEDEDDFSANKRAK